MFHFHKWVEIRKVVKDPTVSGGEYVSNTYRYCDCGKWQAHFGNYGGTWWEDCAKPNLKLKD